MFSSNFRNYMGTPVSIEKHEFLAKALVDFLIFQYKSKGIAYEVVKSNGYVHITLGKKGDGKETLDEIKVFLKDVYSAKKLQENVFEISAENMKNFDAPAMLEMIGISRQSPPQPQILSKYRFH